ASSRQSHSLSNSPTRTGCFRERLFSDVIRQLTPALQRSNRSQRPLSEDVHLLITHGLGTALCGRRSHRPAHHPRVHLCGFSSYQAKHSPPTSPQFPRASPPLKLVGGGWFEMVLRRIQSRFHPLSPLEDKGGAPLFRGGFLTISRFAERREC